MCAFLPHVQRLGVLQLVNLAKVTQAPIKHEEQSMRASISPLIRTHGTIQYGKLKYLVILLALFFALALVVGLNVVGSPVLLYLLRATRLGTRNLIDARSYDEVFGDNHPGTDKSRVPIDSFNRASGMIIPKDLVVAPCIDEVSCAQVGSCNKCQEDQGKLHDRGDKEGTENISHGSQAGGDTHVSKRRANDKDFLCFIKRVDTPPGRDKYHDQEMRHESGTGRPNVCPNTERSREDSQDDLFSALVIRFKSPPSPSRCGTVLLAQCPLKGPRANCTVLPVVNCWPRSFLSIGKMISCLLYAANNLQHVALCNWINVASKIQEPIA
eukprot:Gb_22815 [translate_table: standard]